MRWKGAVPPATVSHEIASTIDLLPTIAHWGRVLGSLWRIVDGLDIRELITGPSEARSPRQSFYFYAGDELHACVRAPGSCICRMSI